MYSTVVEHFVTHQWFKHCVKYHFVSCIQTCKRCWEKLYNVNLRYYDCWRTIVPVLVTTVHFSWYQWFTSESMHVSELEVAAAAQSYNLTPLYEFSLVWGGSLYCSLCSLYNPSTWLHMYESHVHFIQELSLLCKIIRCNAIFMWIS